MLTTSTLALVVASSLLWSGYDLTRKLLVDRLRPTPLLVLLTAGQGACLAVWVAVDGWQVPAPGYLAPAAASVVLNVVANFAFIYAFKVAPLSLTVPLLSLIPVFTALSAIPLLGELPTPRQGLGIALVVFGAFLINLRQAVAEEAVGEATHRAVFGRALRRHQGALLMVVVAVCWSLTTPLDKLALQAATAPVHGFVLCVGVAVAAGVVLVLERRVGELGQVVRAPWVFAVALVLSAVALATQLLAIRVVWVSLMETIKRGLGNLAALAYGKLFFGESVTAVKVAGVAMISAGVALILV